MNKHVLPTPEIKNPVLLTSIGILTRERASVVYKNSELVTLDGRKWVITYLDGDYCTLLEVLTAEDMGITPEDKQPIKSEWTDSHYNNTYTLTEDDIAAGEIKLDVYKVAKVWKIGSKDDSGALWHSLKTIARFGEKNSREREVKALYAQIKCLAKIESVDLD